MDKETKEMIIDNFIYNIERNIRKLENKVLKDGLIIYNTGSLKLLEELPARLLACYNAILPNEDTEIIDINKQ
jgi:hypothetical protein